MTRNRSDQPDDSQPVVSIWPRGQAMDWVMILWSLVALLAWLSTVSSSAAERNLVGSTGQLSDSTLTIVGGLWLVVGGLLKWYAIAAAESRSLSRFSFDQIDQTAVPPETIVTRLLLGTIGNLNWLGFWIAFGANAYSALPLLLVFLSIEAASWGILRSALTRIVAEGRIHFTSQNSIHADSLDTRAVDNADSEQSEDTVEDPEQGEQIARRMWEGRDAESQRYLAGEVKVSLERAEKSTEVVIGFCPAFDRVPTIDLEADSEQIATRIVRCTPAGTRIQLKRVSAATAIRFTLEWYAVEATESVPSLKLP